MQTVTYSSNNVASTHTQDTPVQMRWQPYKFNSVTDSFHAEGNRVKGIVMAAKEAFANVIKFAVNAFVHLGNKVYTVLNLHPKSTPVVNDQENTSTIDDNDIDFLDFEDDEYYLLLETELPEMEKAQGWTNTQKALAAAAVVGTTGVALKTLAYLGGKDSYSEMPWNYSFGWAGDVLNNHVVQPGMDGLNWVGSGIYDTVCTRGSVETKESFCSESKTSCTTDADCTQPVLPAQTDVCTEYVADSDGTSTFFCSESKADCTTDADCTQSVLPAQTDICEETNTTTDGGDRCVDAGTALKDLFCAATLGYGPGCPA